MTRAKKTLITVAVAAAAAVGIAAPALASTGDPAHPALSQSNGATAHYSLADEHFPAPVPH
ncbi:hypothetical protein [Streptomyces coffeae]|uniref:Uncharacterized protein n=1 Tax=Streptomyces coffeae TaxID=621382 RepID=A0ABS1NHE0_9ACTN|nr:hypothetical protein [Streptomyces coffeae]MBL1099418.1 hypothetical protein [Streptomyces coffeae]